MAARKKVPLSVVSAVERDLKALGGGLAESSLAAAAFALARELDCAENSATSKSMCARALRETMDRLQELAPPKAERDRIDEVSDRRERRRRSAGS